jgi:hypothetical protein
MILALTFIIIINIYMIWAIWGIEYDVKKIHESIENMLLKRKDND